MFGMSKSRRTAMIFQKLHFIASARYTNRDTKHTQKHCPRWRLTRFPGKQEASALYSLCIMRSPLHIYFTIAFCDYIIMEITHKLGKNTLCGS